MSARVRALLIVIAALAASALPTVTAFADPPRLPATVPHSTPREEIQPAANITGQLARRTAERSAGKPLGLIPDQGTHPVALKSPLT
ncbi:hypothetical protein GCM10010277_07300 [Streptomyces longisporoflavus]|uniref:hypothetical protein n=1 Tax=Streptomyces longisporoflavus TaxID=28044 RepID=UPI00167C872A|nr:hypothetical protein [Streptomyces longisporoflavus]GGV26007.1 hypothetical protein GCM10010277_07300 [Streptomyces longisporoflavus]